MKLLVPSKDLQEVHSTGFHVNVIVLATQDSQCESHELKKILHMPSEVCKLLFLPKTSSSRPVGGSSRIQNKAGDP